MKKKKLIITIGIIVVILLIGLGVYLLLFKSDEINTAQVINREEISIGTSDLYVEISKDLDIEKKSASILQTSEKINKAYIETLISKYSIGVELISENEGVTYQWCNKEGSRCLIYDVITDILSFSFQEKPISLEHDISKISDPKAAWSVFITDFNLDNFAYTNERINRSENGFALIANRSFEDIPFENISAQTYTDKVLFNQKGFLISGKLLLVDFTVKESNPLITINKLKEIVNSDIYPKQYIVNKDNLDLGLLPDTQDIDYKYPEELYDLEKCSSSSIELVYIYKTRSVSKYITPAYKIACSSEWEYENSIHNLPLSVYVNAISPDYIVIE